MARKLGDKVDGAGDWKAGFLAFYRRYPNVMRAARSVKVSRAMVYKEAAQNPEFKAQFEEARADGIEAIEGLAMELAHLRDWHYNSVRLVMLKAWKPEVYGDKSEVRLKGSVEEPVRVEVAANLKLLSDEEFETLEHIVDKLAQAGTSADAGGDAGGAPEAG